MLRPSPKSDFVREAKRRKLEFDSRMDALDDELQKNILSFRSDPTSRKILFAGGSSCQLLLRTRRHAMRACHPPADITPNQLLAALTAPFVERLQRRGDDDASRMATFTSHHLMVRVRLSNHGFQNLQVQFRGEVSSPVLSAREVSMPPYFDRLVTLLGRGQTGTLIMRRKLYGVTSEPPQSSVNARLGFVLRA